MVNNPRVADVSVPANEVRKRTTDTDDLCDLRIHERDRLLCLQVRLTVARLPAAAVANVVGGGTTSPCKIYAKVPRRVRTRVSVVVGYVWDVQLPVLPFIRRRR